MIAGQPQSQGQEYEYRIHLKNLRDPDGLSWLVKFRADASVQLIRILNSLMEFSQGQNCWR